MLNLYVMPIVGTGATHADARRPKYRNSIFPAPIVSEMWDYGNEPWCLVGILDIPAATNTALVANADVLDVPDNLAQLVGSGAALTKVRNGLESVNIPGTWIQSTNTWGDVVRFVGAVCQFAQRYQGQTGGLWFSGGVTLASTFGSLPVAARNGLSAAASSFGFDVGGVTGSTTLRAILLSVGQQYLATQPPLQLAGVIL